MAQPKSNAHGRYRRTARALFGDSRRSELTPLSPVDQAAAVINRLGLNQQYRTTLAGINSESALIRAKFRSDRADIRQAVPGALDEAGGSLEERGMLGSTVAQHERERVFSARDAALQAAFGDKTQGLQAALQRKLEAQVAHRLGLQQLALQKAAAQQQASLDLYGGPTRKESDYKLDTSAATSGAGGASSDYQGTTSGGHKLDHLSNLFSKLGARLDWSGIDQNDFRSFAHQTELWQAALKKYGDPEIADNWVARPGTSHHEFGWAVDVNRAVENRFADWVENHPFWSQRLYRPMPWEPWHWEIKPGYGGR